MAKEYVLTVDQSTSATKAILFDQRALPVYRVNIEHRQYYPEPGWVEHDAEEILRNTREALVRVIRESGVDAASISSLGITNQRETVVAWDAHSGKPVYHALVWQDERGTPYCDALISGKEAATIQQKTGLIVDTYFSATKLQWLLEHSETAQEVAQAGRLMCGTMDTWLIWNLTERKVFATDHSNACRTLLLNIGTLSWDPELKALFGLSQVILPELRTSGGDYGIANLPAANLRLPIRGVLGDSHAALYGQAAFSPGQAKTTYGTGSSIMMNAGADVPVPPAGIVASIGWSTTSGTTYVYEGNIHYTGDTVRWVRENLGLFTDIQEAEQLAASLPDNGGVYLVPAFSGLGAPHWVHGIRACITGLSRASGKPQIIRAAFESIAYQVSDVMNAMTSGSGIAVQDLRVDGGATGNQFLMQFQADVLNAPIHVASIEEISARGVAFMAGIASGVFPGESELHALAAPGRTHTPNMESRQRAKLMDEWHHAVTQTLT